MGSQIENLSTIKYCMEQIEKNMSESDAEYHWLWEVRLKIAQYVYSYLLLHEDSKKARTHELSEQQKQDIMQTHPLLEPFTQPSIGVTSQQKKDIQKEIYDKVHRMYFSFTQKDSEK